MMQMQMHLKVLLCGANDGLLKYVSYAVILQIVADTLNITSFCIVSVVS